MAALIWLVCLIGGGFWYYTENSASAGLTGKEHYEACWERRSKTVGFNDPKPSTPYQASQWKNCEPVVLRQFYSKGMIFAGNETGPEFDRIRAVCPNKWSEVPMAGLYYFYIADIEAEGGVGRLFGFLPASASVSSWLSKRWPDCAKVRAAQGFSQIVEKSDGQFGWEKPCPNCK